MGFFNNIPNPLGGLNNGGFLRSSRHATKNLGLAGNVITQNYPRHKFQYFVKINFNDIDTVNTYVNSFLAKDDQDMVFNLIKTVDLPSMKIDTDVLNQYNKKRISQTKIQFDPISMSLWDVVDGKSLRLWEMYYMYYFKEGSTYSKLENEDGRSLKKEQFKNDIITETFNNNYGLNLDRINNNKYLIESIDIFQVHRTHFSKVKLVRPRIESFNHDTLSFDETGSLVELKFDFVYEDVVYSNNNTKLNDEELATFANAGYLDLTTAITAEVEPKSRKITEEEKLPSPPTTNSSSPQQPELFDGVGNSIADSITNGVFTGDFSLNPNPVNTARNAANTYSQTLQGNVRRSFQASARSLISNPGSSFSANGSGNTDNDSGQSSTDD